MISQGSLAFEPSNSNYRSITLFTFPNTRASSVNMAQELGAQLLSLDKSTTTLILLDSNNSLSGHHYFFKIYYKNVPIFGTYLKINTNKSGLVQNVFYCAPQQIPFIETQNINDNVVFFPIQNQFYSCIQSYIHEGDRHEMQIHWGDSLVYKEDLNLYYTDSVAEMMVFLPDPLTSAQVYYGAPYVDNNDNDVAELNAERFSVSMPVHYDSGFFYLENDYVKIIDISLPNIAPVVRTDPYFNYTRSEDGFEDVSAYYHINVFQNYLHSIGFTDLVQYQMDVDTHGNGSADNSFFSPLTSPPQLILGIGGVDDAEDADVIIHEYSHAVSYSIAPGTNSGTARNAMDEALGDYFASSYSKNLSAFRAEDVFTWDGHNTFWPGRSTATSKVYPGDITNNYYEDAQLWSSTLMDINNAIGRENTDKILLESWYNYYPNMDYPDAALLYLKADTLLNGAMYSDQICSVFEARGLYSCLTKVSEYQQDYNINIKNSEGFSRGQICQINLKTSEPVSFELYDVLGRLQMNQLTSSSETHKTLSVSGLGLKPGLYILSIRVGKNQIKTYSLLRFTETW